MNGSNQLHARAERRNLVTTAGWRLTVKSLPESSTFPTVCTPESEFMIQRLENMTGSQISATGRCG